MKQRGKTRKREKKRQEKNSQQILPIISVDISPSFAPLQNIKKEKKEKARFLTKHANH